MNQKELKELIEFLIEKDIAEFELERGDVKVKIKRAGEHTVVHTRAEVPYVAVTVPQPGRLRLWPHLPHRRQRRSSRLRKKTCTS